MQSPFNWMGPDSGTPGIFQFLAAFSEFGGGLAWIIGFFAPLAALGIFSTMVVALYTMAVAMGAPFINPTGGPSYEIVAVYLTVSLIIMTAGAGRYSLDAKIFGVRRVEI